MHQEATSFGEQLLAGGVGRILFAIGMAVIILYAMRLAAYLRRRKGGNDSTE